MTLELVASRNNPNIDAWGRQIATKPMRRPRAKLARPATNGMRPSDWEAVERGERGPRYNHFRWLDQQATAKAEAVRTAAAEAARLAHQRAREQLPAGDTLTSSHTRSAHDTKAWLAWGKR